MVGNLEARQMSEMTWKQRCAWLGFARREADGVPTS